MKYLSIALGKFCCFVLHKINRGGSWPGKISLLVDKNILKKINYPSVKIVVSGSSGKGSTVALLTSILNDNGYTVCTNDSGANLLYGFTTACINSCNFKGYINKDAMVMEVDEKYLKHVFKSFTPDYLIITNITKDQPPRQHNIDITYQEIIKELNPKTRIITTIDDPFLRKFELELNNEVIYYTITMNKHSYKKQIFENLNCYCPKCLSKLKYEYYNFESMGGYNCPLCGLNIDNCYVTAKNLNLDKQTININNETIYIGGDMLFFAYNSVSCFTMAKLIGLDEKEISKSINKVNKEQLLNINKTFVNNKKLYKLLKVKAEDAPTWNQAILKIYQDDKIKDVIIALNKISGRYSYEDISWLYDIAFELINNKNIHKIYLFGNFKEDFRKRLILARIAPDKLILSESLYKIKDVIIKDKIDIIYSIINYDCISLFNEVFMEEEK